MGRFLLRRPEGLLTETRVPEFNRKVYAIARGIPPGQTLSYGDIAKQLGGVELSRDVGQAMGLCTMKKH